MSNQCNCHQCTMIRAMEGSGGSPPLPVQVALGFCQQLQENVTDSDPYKAADAVGGDLYDTRRSLTEKEKEAYHSCLETIKLYATGEHWFGNGGEGQQEDQQDEIPCSDPSPLGPQWQQEIPKQPGVYAVSWPKCPYLYCVLIEETGRQPGEINVQAAGLPVVTEEALNQAWWLVIPEPPSMSSPKS